MYENRYDTFTESNYLNYLIISDYDSYSTTWILNKDFKFLKNFENQFCLPNLRVQNCNHLNNVFHIPVNVRIMQ